MEVKISMNENYINYFKSIIDQDRSSIVICNLKHEIVYMNPTAIKNYEKRGGEKLIGRSLLNCHNAESVKRIQEIVDWLQQMKIIIWYIRFITKNRIKMYTW